MGSWSSSRWSVSASVCSCCEVRLSSSPANARVADMPSTSSMMMRVKARASPWSYVDVRLWAMWRCRSCDFIWWVRFGGLVACGLFTTKPQAWACGFSIRVVLMIVCYASILAELALRSMKSRRWSTSSPMSIEKVWSASAAFSSVTRLSRRFSGFIVVSQSCSLFISPRPL